MAEASIQDKRATCITLVSSFPLTLWLVTILNQLLDLLLGKFVNCVVLENFSRKNPSCIFINIAFIWTLNTAVISGPVSQYISRFSTKSNEMSVKSLVLTQYFNFSPHSPLMWSGFLLSFLYFHGNCFHPWYFDLHEFKTYY